MRALFAAVAFTLATTGCVVAVPHRGAVYAPASTQKSCPPGHQWSDGQCHDKGKGHDRAKHHDD